MKLKSIIPPSIFISIIIALNGIATAIEHPNTYKKELPDAVSVAELQLDSYIESISKRYGLDSQIIKALIEEESRWNASAEGDGGESIGLMQVQPRWHRERLERLGVTNLYDPQQNVRVGCDILSELLNKYGNYEDALSVYNSGNTLDGREYAERILKK